VEYSFIIGIACDKKWERAQKLESLAGKPRTLKSGGSSLAA